MGAEFHLNGDFDLGLRRDPGDRDKFRFALEELTTQWIAAGRRGDSVRVARQVDSSYLEYLEGFDRGVPDLTILPAHRPRQTYRPFGWDTEAVRANRGYDSPSPHPPPEIVRRVNGRSFAADLVDRDFRPIEARTLDRVRDIIATGEGDRLLKAEHSNAGLGNRRLRGGHLAEADVRWIRTTLAACSSLMVEPWIPRLKDFSATFELTPEGERLPAAINETLNTADGGFIGIWIDPSPDPLGPWKDRLEATLDDTAAALHGAGYFGPVTLDAIATLAPSPTMVTPVDLNAREAVSMAPRRLHQDLAPDRTAQWRFYNSRKFSFPIRIHRFLERLGPLVYDPRSRRGILLMTPPATTDRQGRLLPSRKLSVLGLGSDRREVEEDLRAFEVRFALGSRRRGS